MINFTPSNRYELSKALERAMIEENKSVSDIAKATNLDKNTINAFRKSRESVRYSSIVKIFNSVNRGSFLSKFVEDTVSVIKKNISYSKVEIGVFYIYRFSFHKTEEIYKIRLEIKEVPNLNERCFKEYFLPHVSDNDDEYFNYGRITSSEYTNLIHFITEWSGSVRLMTVMQIKHQIYRYGGTLQTQSYDQNVFKPSISPVLIAKAPISEMPGEQAFVQIIGKENSQYETLRDDLMNASIRFGTLAVGVRQPQ